VSGLTSVCYSAAANPDGTLGPWQTETSLPLARWAADGLAHGGRIYVPGGMSGGSTSTVYYSSPLTGAAEVPGPVVRRRLLTGNLGPGVNLYDALGRRVRAGRARSGVYFQRPGSGGAAKAVLVR
jgi:hypothetical protein